MAVLKADGHMKAEPSARPGPPQGQTPQHWARGAPKDRTTCILGKQAGWAQVLLLCAPSSPQGPCVKAPKHESWARVCPMYKSQKKGLLEPPRPACPPTGLQRALELVSRQVLPDGGLGAGGVPKLPPDHLKEGKEGTVRGRERLDKEHLRTHACLHQPRCSALWHKRSALGCKPHR